MCKPSVILIALLLCGCHRTGSTSDENELTISVRQPWADAVSAAKRSGLPMSDAAGSETLPTPEGYRLDLPGDQALLVFRGSKTDTVAALQRVAHWAINKKDRVYFELQTFQLPAKK